MVNKRIMEKYKNLEEKILADKEFFTKNFPTLESIILLVKNVLLVYFGNDDKYISLINNINEYSVEFRDNKIFAFKTFIETNDYDSIKIELDFMCLNIEKQAGHTKFEPFVKIPISLIRCFVNNN